MDNRSTLGAKEKLEMFFIERTLFPVDMIEEIDRIFDDAIADIAVVPVQIIKNILKAPIRC